MARAPRCPCSLAACASPRDFGQSGIAVRPRAGRRRRGGLRAVARLAVRLHRPGAERLLADRRRAGRHGRARHRHGKPARPHPRRAVRSRRVHADLSGAGDLDRHAGRVAARAACAGAAHIVQSSLYEARARALPPAHPRRAGADPPPDAGQPAGRGFTTSSPAASIGSPRRFDDCDARERRPLRRSARATARRRRRR